MGNERIGEVSLDINLKANTIDFQKEVAEMVENTNRTLEGIDASALKSEIENFKKSLDSLSETVNNSIGKMQNSLNELGISKNVIDSFNQMATAFNEMTNNKLFDSLGNAANLLNQNFESISKYMKSMSQEPLNTSDEVTKLSDVKKVVDDINNAVIEKNKSFVDEEKIVADSAAGEVEHLQKVLAKVEAIRDAVNQTDFKTFDRPTTTSSENPVSGSSSVSSRNSQNNSRSQIEQRRVNSEILAIDEADRQADQFRQQGLAQEAAILQRNREYLQVWEQIPQAIENAKTKMAQYQSDSAYAVNPEGLESASRWITQWIESLDQGRISLGTFQERVDQLFSKLEADTHKLGQLDKINQVLNNISNHKFADILSTDSSSLIEPLSELTELVNMGLDDSSFETELERINSVLSDSINQLTNLETAANNAFGVLSETEDKYQRLLFKRGGTDADGGSNSNFTTKELNDWLIISQRRADAARDIAAAEAEGINFTRQRTNYENQSLQIQQRIDALRRARRTDPIIQAYKTLTNSEEKYQELLRKRGDSDSNLTDKEIRQLAKLQQSRDRANEALSQVTILTREQNEAYEEYNRAVQLAVDVTNRLNQAESERNSRKYGTRLGNIDSESAASSFISQQIQSNGWTQLSNISKKVSRNGSIDYSVQIRNANRELQKMVYHLEAAGNGAYTVYENITNTTHASSLWERIVDTMTGKFKALTSYLLSFAAVQQIWNQIKIGAGYVKDLNSQLTEMRKVSDESIGTLKKYQAETFKIADAVGTTAVQIQSSTADYLRLGESLSSAAELAKNTNILLNVSEFDSIEAATESMIAMKQAYTELESLEIIDVLNKIGNEYSVSTSDLAEALKDSAAVLRTQGNDLAESVALITAGNAITQDTSKTAGGIRTISLRIAGTEEAKDELASLGEDVDDFVVQTQSKTQQLIKNYTAVASNAYEGVDVLDPNGNLRNTYDILLDISKVYKEIQKEDKKAGTNRSQALVEAIAGKNRSNVAASILLNPELLESVYESAQDASGSAQKELNTYLDSTEAHLKKFTNATQEMWSASLNSELLNFFIDVGTGAAKLTTFLGGLIPVVTGLGAALASMSKNVGRENCYPSWNMPTHISSLFKEKSFGMWLAFAS